MSAVPFRPTPEMRSPTIEPVGQPVSPARFCERTRLSGRATRERRCAVGAGASAPARLLRENGPHPRPLSQYWERGEIQTPCTSSHRSGYNRRRDMSDADCLDQTGARMTNDRLQRVFTEIDNRRDQLIADLQSLVRIPSVTGDEGAVQDQVQSLFETRNLQIDRWETSREDILPYMEHVGDQPSYEGRPNVVGTLAGAGNGRSIMLNGHIDVVDPGDASFWKHGPWSGAVEGDLLYGRGSCDMKGGMATFLLAIDALNAAGIKLAGEVKIAATVGEEDGGFGSLGTILRGHRADGVVISEPTRLAIVAAQAGSLVARITVTGKSAHGAMRDEGVSAVEKFIPIFQDLQRWEAERNASLDHPLFADAANKIPISFGKVRSGEWHSTVPETLIAEGRIGLLPGEDMHEFQEAVRQRVLNAAKQDFWLSQHPPDVEFFSGQFAPGETRPDEPLPTALASAHQQVTGQAPIVTGITAGTDMRLYTEIGNMPCIIYGAGDVSVAHQNDEHISISDIQTAAKTIATLLIDWCGVTD
ncbi:MAG: ArgE/DapE family deacylase [Sphaerobacteraceae bacterium]|nr:MAG: ArgE/DapE family deacylase [Sphaerobacteraceae bacterium]